MKDIVIYQRTTAGASPAPVFKAIIWDEGDKHPLPIAFYATSEGDARRKAQAFIDERNEKNRSLSERAAKANAGKAAKKETAK